MAERIQRKRTPFWHAPLCSCGCGRTAIYVGRPTRWGNPFRAGTETVLRADHGRSTYEIRRTPKDTHAAVELFREYLTTGIEGWPLEFTLQSPEAGSISDELRGHDLMCWCPLDQPCHADILLDLANSADS